MSTYTPEQVRKLVDGKLDWDTVLRMLSMPKDGERFELYLRALQDKLGWSDRIVLPLGPHLHIVQRAQDKTLQMQARATALDELMASGALDDVTNMGKDNVTMELERLASQNQVESDLAKLKAQIDGGAPPAAIDDKPAGS